MPKLFSNFCASLCALSAIALHADAPMEALFDALPEITQTESIIHMPIEQEAPLIAAPKIETKKIAQKIPEVSVNPFTGKVKAKKVRMRLRPDLDSRIIKELKRNELVTVIGEKGDFWAVQVPSDTKAYIFRSFVLDNVVEGTNVNIRLEPSLEAPVIGHMNAGDKIENPSISPINTKWLEITPPAQTRFYVAKDYLEYVGGPEIKGQMDRRFANAEQLLESSSLLSKTELLKSFEEIDFDRIVRGYHSIIDDYNDFADLAEQAKEALAYFQEAYLQTRITHLEGLAASEQLASAEAKKAAETETNVTALTDKMKLWAPLEEALYLSWTSINDNKSQRDYYDEQSLAAVEISGIVEPYTASVKNKPGDFILRDKDIPVAYVYSTQINLQSLVGKRVNFVAAPRPNNNFAFPAYYVLSVE